jgi:hypothetical protein
MVRCTRYNIMWWSVSVICDRFSLGTPGSSTNTTYEIAQLSLEKTLNSITHVLSVYKFSLWTGEISVHFHTFQFLSLCWNRVDGWFYFDITVYSSSLRWIELTQRNYCIKGSLWLNWTHHFECFKIAIITWLNIMKYMWHKWPTMCSVCRNHNPVLFSFMTYDRVCKRSSTTGATRWVETAYQSRVHPGYECGSCCSICFICNAL